MSWILEGFQILEVLFRMIAYVYRFIYEHMKLFEEFARSIWFDSPKGLKFTEVNNLIDRFHLKERLKESFIMCDKYYLDSWYFWYSWRVCKKNIT